MAIETVSQHAAQSLPASTVEAARVKRCCSDIESAARGERRMVAMNDLNTLPAVQKGTAWVDGWNCVYADDIRSGDLVRADFNQTTVGTGGGLYLVEEWRDGEPVWRGCRRMVKVPDGISIDHEGSGRWERIELGLIGWKVVATVMSVYRPTHYQ